MITALHDRLHLGWFFSILIAAAILLVPESSRAQSAAGCNALVDIVLADLRTGRTVPEDHISWAVTAESRIKSGAPCPPVPAALLTRAQAVPPRPGNAVNASSFPVALEQERARWQQMWTELTNRSVGQQMAYGIAGDSGFHSGDPLDTYGQPTELEKLTLVLGDEKLLQLGRRFQLRSHPAHKRFCEIAPLEQCRAQQAGSLKTQATYQVAWMADPTNRANFERQYGFKPNTASSVQAVGGRTAGGNVTLRVYDRNGNYQGSAVTSATEAGLMGAK